MPGFLRKTVIFLAFVFCVIFAAPGAYAAEQRCCPAGSYGSYYGDGSSCSRCERGTPTNSLWYYADSDQGRIGNCKNYEAADCYRNIPAGEAWDNCNSIGIGGNGCVQKLINCPRGYYCLGEKIYRGGVVSSYANNNYWATQCSTTGLYCGPDHSAYSVPSNCSGCIANNLYPYSYGFLFEGATQCGTNYTTSGRGATASSQCSIRYWNISIKKNDGTSNLVTTIYTVKTNGNTSSAGGDLYSGATDPYDQFTGSLSSGSTVISTAPTRTGYTYGGVYSTSSSTGGTQYINASGALTSSGYTNAAQATANKTWYARWTPKVLTVTLDSKYYATSSTGTGTNARPNAAPSTIYLKYNTGWYGNSGATTVFSSLTTLPYYQEGYLFYGFYTGKAGTGTRVIDENGNIISGNLTVCSENCTLYAYYPQTYTVTFKTGGTTLGTQIFLSGESKALTAVSNFTQPVSSTYGWGFYGWQANYGSTTRTYTDGQSITPTANMTLYGIWRRPVVFKYFAGATTTLFLDLPSYQYYYNTGISKAGVNSVTPPSLVKQTTYNWDPIGWVLNNTTSTTPTISQLAGATPVAITPAKNVVTTPYYALYNRDATLVYNGNTNTGGSTENTVGTQYLNAGQNVAITLPMTLGPNGFTKDGYSFNKWAAGSISGTQYSDGGTFNFPNTAIASSGTYNMYATWNQNCNAVTFNNTTNNSGAIPTSSVLYKLSGDTAWYDNNTCSGTPVTTLLTLPTIAYGSFYGYFLTGISQGTAILSPTTHQLSSTWQITEPKTVYAHYECNTGYSFNSMLVLCAANTITLNWDENGGDAISNGSCTYNGDLVLPAAPTRAGYVFDGWKLANNSTQPAGSTITGGCTSTYTGVTSGTSTAIQAQWTPETYTISYELNGGTNYNGAPTSYTYGVGAVINGTPTHDNGTFAGWCTDSALQNCSSAQNISTSATGAKTFYAKWTCNTGFEGDGCHARCNAITVHIKARGGYLPGYTNVQDVVLYRHSGHIDVDVGGNAYWWADSTCNTRMVKNFIEVTPYRTLPKKDNASFSGVYSNNTDEYAVDNLADYVAKDGTFQDIDINSDVEAWAHFVCEPDYAENGKDIKRLCEKNYTITLNSNGATTSGTGALYTIHNVAVYLDSLRAEGHEMTTLDYPITNPTKTGHTFGGYYSGSGGTGTQYISNTGYITTDGVNVGINATANTTWYGKWTPNRFKITFRTVPLNPNNVETYAQYGTADLYTTVGGSTLATVPLFNIPHGSFGGWNANLAPNGQTPNLVPIYTVNNGVAQLVNTTVAGYVQGGVWVTTEDRNLYPIINCDTGYSLDGDTGECVANDYMVAYDCGTGDGTPPAFEYATYNASFTPAVNTCTKTGYNFSGWMVSRDPNDIKPESIAFTWTYTEDKRFSAVWTPQTSTVTFNKNASDAVAGSPQSVTATYDAAMPTPVTSPTRPGYTFMGYYDTPNATGGTQYYGGYEGNGSGNIQSAHVWNKVGDQTLYARWAAKCNQIRFDGTTNGGTSLTRVLYKLTDDPAWYITEKCRETTVTTLRGADITPPIKSNAMFTGFFENAGIPAGTKVVDDEMTMGALSTTWTVNGDTTIYAHYDCDEHWQGNGVDISGACDSGTQYNIYYVMNGGTNYAGAPTSYTYGTGATINGIPTREHSDFIDWCTDSALAYCGSYQEISTTDYGDKTFYAQWKCFEGYSANNDGSACVANTITLDWDEGGGSAIANGSCTYDGDLILPAAPSRTGYTFVEWVLHDGTAKSAGTTVDNGCVYEKTGVYEGTSTNIISAKWTANTYTIAYAGMTGATHGDNHPTSATYDEGVEVSAPSKPGYTFAGWNISGMDTTTHYHGTTSANTAFNTTTLNGTMSTKFRNLRASSGTVTFTATWSADVYTITLSDGTGTSQSGMPNPIYLKYNTGWYSNSAATTGIGALAATPIKIGYLFEGYYTNSDGTGTQIINNVGTIVANNTAFVANATIYAKYTAQTGFTVTTTNLAANTTFKFAISAAGQFYVDWGDGTVTPLNRENNTTETPVLHTYATAGVKTITIYGRATGYNAGNSVAVIRFGADANAAVAGVTNTLVSGVSGSLATVFPTISGTQPKFVRTFGTCTNLTGAIPAGLFSGLSGAPVADMFLGTFEMDVGLTGTIPAGLFSAVSGAVQTGTFKDTFKGCANLTGYVPRGLFTTFSGGNVANTHTDMFVDSGLASECPCGMTQYTTGFENTDGKINTKVSCQLGTKIGEYWHNGHCVTECAAGITRLKTSNGVDVPLLRAKVGIKNVAFKHDNEVCYSPVETGNLSGHVNLKQGATTYHISEPDGIEPDGFRNLPDGVLPAPGYTVE